MVDYSSLENYRTERYRGFESLSLRKQNVTLLIIRGLLFLCCFYTQNYTQFRVGYTQFYTQVLFTFVKILISRFAVSVKILISHVYKFGNKTFFLPILFVPIEIVNEKFGNVAKFSYFCSDEQERETN